MEMTRAKFETIDAYIAAQPKEVQSILKKLRQTIRRAAPKAEETISYGMPAYKMGAPVVYFAAFKKNIGFYPNPGPIPAFKKELAGL